MGMPSRKEISLCLAKVQTKRSMGLSVVNKRLLSANITLSLLPYPKILNETFPFLQLPGQIRVKIYRFMLLEEYALDSKPNPAYELSPLESGLFSEPDSIYGLSPPDSEPFAEQYFTEIPHLRNIRYQKKALDTFHMQTNILLVNRQSIQRLSASSTRMNGIRIGTDLDELSADLQDKEYAIICNPFPSQTISFPVLYLSLKLRAALDLRQTMTFLLCI